MSWFYSALIGIVLITVYSIGTKLLVEKRVTDVISLVIVYKLMCSICVVVLILGRGEQLFFSITGFEVFLYGAGAVIFGMANIYVFKAFPITEVSDISLIGSTQPVITMLLGAALFHEGLSVPKVLAVGLCMAGVWMIYPRKKGTVMTRGHIFALVSTAAFALGAFIDKYMVMRIAILQYAAFGYLITGLAIKSGTRRSWRDLGRVLAGKTTTFWIMALAVFSAVGSLFYIQAYVAGGQASEVSLVLYLNVVLTVIFGAVFLHERDRIPQKFAAFMLTLIALVLIRQ